MILVDTPVWIDHLRRANDQLATLLQDGKVSMHPFVVGELACGNLADRANVLHLLRSLQRTPAATDEEVLFFIERHLLAGRGLGYIDMHLLAACALNRLDLWTTDRRLNEVATLLGLVHRA